MECTCCFETEDEPIMCVYCASLILIELPIIVKSISPTIMSELLSFCDELNLYQFQRDCVFRKWRQLNRNFKGRRRKIIFVICIYYGLIVCETPRTIDELCQIYQITLQEFKMGVKIVGPCDENVNISFYHRFVRMVERFNLPFHYADRMDKLMSRSYNILDLSLDKMINVIFIFIITEKDLNNSEKIEEYCKLLNLSKYLYQNIKPKLINI